MLLGFSQAPLSFQIPLIEEALESCLLFDLETWEDLEVRNCSLASRRTAVVLDLSPVAPSLRPLDLLLSR